MSSRTRAEPILAWGALPPPLHGQAFMNAATRDVMGADFRLIWYDATSSDGIEDVGRPSAGKYVRGAVKVARLVATSIRLARRHVTYISPASSGPALTRDTIVWLVAVVTSRRTIVHIHTASLAFVDAHGPLRGLRHRLVRHSEVWILAEQWAPALVRLGAPCVRVIENGVGCPDCAGGAPTSRRPARSGPLHIVFVGNIAMAKGIEVFLDVVVPFVDAGEAIVTVAGAVGDTEAARLVSEVSACRPGAVRRIVSLGPAERCHLLLAADVLLFPSRLDEGQPLVVCEAMEHGVIPVVSSRGGLPALVSGVGMSCASNSELSAALAALVTDRVLLVELSEACRRRWLERYTRQAYDERICTALWEGSATPAGPDSVSVGRLRGGDPMREVSVQEFAQEAHVSPE